MTADDQGTNVVGHRVATSAPGSSLLRNVAALFSAQVVTWTISTAVMVIMPRRVGPDAIGAYRVATSLWMVAGVVITFGSTRLVTLDLARDRAQSAIDLRPVLVARMIGFLLVVPPLAGFALVVGYDSLVVVLLVIVGIGTLFATFGDAYAAALTGLERLGPVARSDVLVKVVGAILVIGAVFFTRDIRVLAGLIVLSLLLSPMTLAPALHRLRPVNKSTTWLQVRTVVRRSLPYLAVGVAFVAYNQADVVIMSLLVTDVEIGWYSTADVLFGTMLFVPTILMRSLFPVLARRNEEDPAAAKQLLVQSFMTLLFFAVPVGLGTLVVAAPLATLLYGSQFAGAGPVLAVLGVVLILTFQTVLLGSHATAIGRERLWTVVLAIAVPMTILLDLVFVPWTRDRFDNGAIGGALSYLVTEGMMLVVGVWKLAPELLSRSVTERMAKCLLAGGVMVAVTWPYRDVLIAVPIAVGALVYVLVLTATQPFSSSEKAAFRRITRRLPGRRN